MSNRAAWDIRQLLDLIGEDQIFGDVNRQKRELPTPGTVRRFYPAGTTIVHEHQAKQAILIMKAGWAAFVKTQSNGSGLIIDFALPHEIALIEFSGGTSDSVIALSDITAIELAGPVRSCLSRYPQPICDAIFLAEMKRYSRATEQLARVGRRGSLERAIHLLLELGCRASGSARSYPDRFNCPLTQAQFGDALCLSAVHVSRVLKALRESGLASFRKGVVELRNHAALVEKAGFDPAYLQLTTG